MWLTVAFPTFVIAFLAAFIGGWLAMAANTFLRIFDEALGKDATEQAKARWHASILKMRFWSCLFGVLYGGYETWNVVQLVQGGFIGSLEVLFAIKVALISLAGATGLAIAIGKASFRSS